MASHSDQTEFMSCRHQNLQVQWPEFNVRFDLYVSMHGICGRTVFCSHRQVLSPPGKPAASRCKDRTLLYFMWRWLDVTFACSISFALFQFEICVCIDRGSPMEPETQLWLLALAWVSNTHAKVEVSCTSRVKFSMNAAKKFP